MASFNGFVAQLIKGSSTGGEYAVLTGVSRVTTIPDGVPKGPFRHPWFGVNSQGHSGGYYVTVACAVGGATAVFAEGAVSAEGSVILGLTNPAGGVFIDPESVPRPTAVGFSTTTASSGFTATVYLCGEY